MLAMLLIADVLVAVDDKGVLLVRVLRDCHVVVSETNKQTRVRL